MDLNDIVRSQGGIGAIADQLGITPQQAEQGAAALLPSILHGFGNRTTGDTGDAGGGLGSILESLGGGALTGNVVGPEPTDVNKGNNILGQIFGSKDVSRQVAQQAAPQAGLSPELLKKMLPILAMLVAGYLSSRAKEQGGGLGSVLGPILGGLAGGSGGGVGGSILGSVLGSVLGGRR